MSEYIRVIKPYNVEALIDTFSATLPDTSVDCPVYAAATAYVPGQCVTSSKKVYKCILAGTAKTPSSNPTYWAELLATAPTYEATSAYAAGAVVVWGKRVYACTLAGTGKTPDLNPGYWAASSRDYPAWLVGVAYATSDRVSYSGNLYAPTKALTALANTTNPKTSAAQATGALWLRVSCTNQRMMFDSFNHSRATAYGESMSFTYTIDAGVAKHNALALLNLEAASVRVEMSKNAASVFDTTYSLYGAPTGSWWVENMDKTTSVLVELPSSSLADVVTIKVTIARPGSLPACGACVVGRMQQIGDASSSVKYGASVAMTDYSKTSINEFGEVSLVQRAWAKKASVSMTVPNTQLDGIQRLMAGMRATPAIWACSNSYESLILYGLCKSYSAIIAYPMKTEMQLEIEGFI